MDAHVSVPLASWPILIKKSKHFPLSATLMAVEAIEVILFLVGLSDSRDVFQMWKFWPRPSHLEGVRSQTFGRNATLRHEGCGFNMPVAIETYSWVWHTTLSLRCEAFLVTFKVHACETCLFIFNLHLKNRLIGINGSVSWKCSAAVEFRSCAAFPSYKGNLSLPSFHLFFYQSLEMLSYRPAQPSLHWKWAFHAN